MADIRQPFPQPPSTGRELVARPNFTIPGEAPYPRSGPPQAAPQPTARDPRFATKPLSPEAQQFRSTMVQGPKTPPGWTPPSAAPTAASAKAPMPSTGGIRRAGEVLKSGATNLAKSPVKTLAYGAGNLTANVVKGAPLALGAHTVSHFNDYKIDDPGVDSSAAGALAAITKGDFAGAGRSLSKGALETSMDLGSAGANLLDYVVPGKAPVSSAYDRMLRSTFGDQLVGPSGATEPPAPTAEQAAAAAPAPTAAAAPAPIPTADPNIGPHPDLTQALASVPQNMPAGLRDGAVYKTKDANGRTVYSGTNVKQGADMIDGQGKPVGSLRGTYGPSSVQPAAQDFDTSRGTVSTLPAGISPFASAGGVGGSDLGTARQAAADRGDWDAVSRSYGRGGFAGMQPQQQVRQSAPQGLRMDPANNKRVLSMIEQMARSPRARDRNAAAQLLTDLNKAQDRNAVDLQGQQTSADTNRYASDNSLRGSVYSADSSANTQLSVKQMEIQRQQAQRQATAAAYQQAGGNLDAMRELMMANGYDPQVVEQSIAARNTAESANQVVQAKASDRVREDNRVFKDVDGKQVVDEEATQAKMDALRQVFSGTTTMDTDSYEQNAPMVKALGGIFDSARADTNFGVGAYMPWADAPQRLSAMPNWKGGKLSKTSGLKGAFTTGGLEKGNYIIEHNGREMNLGHLDDLQRSLIEEHLKTGLWTPDQTQK